MLHYLIPKVKSVAGPGTFNGVRTLNDFKNACERHEKKLRFMVTAKKPYSILGKLINYLPNVSNVTRSQLDELEKEVYEFGVWQGQQLEETFGASFLSAGFFNLVYEITPVADRSAYADFLKNELNFKSGSKTTFISCSMKLKN